MTVEITSPGKLLFPADGVTKADLASYYERVAEWMLPHIRGRPLSLQRFPAGIAQRGFFHKDVPDYFPDWVERVEVAKHDGSVTHALAGNVDTLLYLVGQNTITPHVWTASTSPTGLWSTWTPRRARTSLWCGAPLDAPAS